MPQYSRVVTFEADDAAIEALLGEIKASDGPPEGLPAKRLTVLADRAAGKLVVAVRFDSEEDLRVGSEMFEAMSPLSSDVAAHHLQQHVRARPGPVLRARPRRSSSPRTSWRAARVLHNRRRRQPPTVPSERAQRPI